MGIGHPSPYADHVNAVIQRPRYRTAKVTGRVAAYHPSGRIYLGMALGGFGCVPYGRYMGVVSDAKAKRQSSLHGQPTLHIPHPAFQQTTPLWRLRCHLPQGEGLLRAPLDENEASTMLQALYPLHSRGQVQLAQVYDLLGWNDENERTGEIVSHTPNSEFIGSRQKHSRRNFNPAKAGVPDRVTAPQFVRCPVVLLLADWRRLLAGVLFAKIFRALRSQAAYFFYFGGGGHLPPVGGGARAQLAISQVSAQPAADQAGQGVGVVAGVGGG